MTNIIINGAKGKMGQAAVEAVNADNTLSLVAELGRNDNLADCIKDTKAKVVVDLTCADVALQNTQTIIESGAHPVIGTSGLLPDQVSSLQALSKQKKLGGIIAPNFSIGIVLMTRMLSEAAKYYDYAEIIEMHHEQKKDAPSGTSIKLAKTIADTRKNHLENCKEIITGALGAKVDDVPIHSVRMPGLVAHHKAIFGKDGETFSIQHDSIDRKHFMPGLILCCKKAPELNELLYGLESIM